MEGMYLKKGKKKKGFHIIMGILFPKSIFKSLIVIKFFLIPLRVVINIKIILLKLLSIDNLVVKYSL